jgi:hypothetical protein
MGPMTAQVMAEGEIFRSHSSGATTVTVTSSGREFPWPSLTISWNVWTPIGSSIVRLTPLDR